MFSYLPQKELACTYKTPLYKIQYSEIVVEYEKGFDMNTGKLLINLNPTHHISNHDENSYIQVTFLKKKQEILEENFDHKTKSEHVYENYHP